MPRDWLIIDAPNAVWRAFYSTGGKEALPSVLCALLEIERMAAEFDCTDLAFAFDKKPYRRRELYAGYKASRDVRKVDEEEADAIDACRLAIDKLRSDYLPKLGYQNVLAKRGYEADDMLAQAAKDCEAPDRCILVTADQDLYQCLSRTCAVYHPQRNQFVTAKSFRAEKGIDPSRWAEVKAIAGCSSDDIPGVEGVGEATAIKHLTKGIPRLHKVAWKLHEFVKSPEYQRNLTLTRLPFEDCPWVTLEPDPPRPKRNWAGLCEVLGLDHLNNEYADERMGSLFA